MEYKEERIYNFKDLICKFLSHIKWAFLLMGILACIFAGLKYAKDVKNNNQLQPEQKKVSSAEEIEKLKETDKNCIKNVASLYLDLMKINEYNEKSIVMALDPYAVPESKLRYQIKAESQNDTDAIMISYFSSIFEEESIQKLMELSGTELSLEINELVTSEFGVNYTSTIITDATTVFNLDIKASSMESVKKMKEYVKSRIEAKHNEIYKKIGSHKIQLISESCYVRKDNGILNIQTDRNNRAFNLQNQINTLSKELDNNQRTLLKSYVEELVSAQGEGVVEEDEVEVIQTKTSISKKYILLGAFVGLFLYCMIIGLFWLLDGKLQSVSEFKSNYDVIVYGSLKDNQRKGLFHGLVDIIKNWGQARISNEKSIQLILGQMNFDYEKNNYDTLILSGSCLDRQDNNDVIQHICQEAEKRQMDIKVFSHFTENMDALREAADCGAVVLIEQIGRSYHNNIKTEIKKCQEYGINVLGYILLDK